ncbi:hypothetical protein TNCV_3754491 [Trichonephila clavipes]|nr:hypothetical protein TNCV_3754491 [Trichonephila clavipes]
MFSSPSSSVLTVAWVNGMQTHWPSVHREPSLMNPTTYCLADTLQSCCQEQIVSAASAAILCSFRFDGLLTVQCRSPLDVAVRGRPALWPTSNISCCWNRFHNPATTLHGDPTASADTTLCLHGFQSAAMSQVTSCHGFRVESHRGSLNGHDQEFEAVVVKSLVLVLMLLKIYRVEVADISEICRGSKFSRWLVWKLGDWGTQLPDNPPGTIISLGISVS